MSDRPVEDIAVNGNTSISDLLGMMNRMGGFTAAKIGEAYGIIKEMKADPECKIFFSFPACIIATGLRGLIKDMVKNRLVDVIITTCGTLDHDLARIWKHYYQGTFFADDAKLAEQGINRLGNVFVPNESYGIVLEERLQPMFEELFTADKKPKGTRELIWEVGKRLDDENSIIYWCAKNQIPMYVPGITDGAFGSQLWSFRQKHSDFSIDLFKDEDELAEIVFKHDKTGAIILGGGISKHHTIWWNQYKDGLDYAVYITTAVEHDGSLSGARMREAVSWKKVKPQAKYITVEGDVTVILPLLMGPLL